MRYQVPQFIEVEDKIFGPFTIRQFVYLAGGGGICLMFFTLLPLFLTIILSIPVIILALALAFYEVNGRPFIFVIEHAFEYFVGNKLYLWQQRKPEAPKASDAIPAVREAITPQMSQSRLKDLAWSLNIKDRQSA